MATRKHRDIYVSDQVWSWFMERVRALHGGTETATDAISAFAVDNAVEAALVDFVTTSHVEALGSLKRTEARRHEQDRQEAATAPA